LLNIAAIELSVLNGRCLKRSISDSGILLSRIPAWQDKHNSDKAKFDLKIGFAYHLNQEELSV